MTGFIAVIVVLSALILVDRYDALTDLGRRARELAVEPSHQVLIANIGVRG